MKNKLEKSYIIPVSMCDNTAKLSYPGIFDIFMDMATDHAALLGVGGDALKEKKCFWVAAKTMVKITDRPRMLTEAKAVTWPEKPGNIRCNRYYTIEHNGNILVEGKTEWTILSLESGRPVKTADVYPSDIVHTEDVVCDIPFSRMSADFSDCDEILRHKVVSTDIDLSQHMNNVAYIRAFLSAFSCKEIEEMNIREMEITYRTQCFEGEELSLRMRRCDNSLEIGAVKEDGKCAAILRIN